MKTDAINKDSMAFTSSAQLKEVIASCPHSFDTTTRVITSPNYPGDYENDQYCEWTIQAQAGQTIELEIMWLDIEPDEGFFDGSLYCYDGLIIYDDRARNNRMFGGALCGKGNIINRNVTIGTKIRSTNRYMHLVFGSDNSNTHIMSGFELSYSFVKLS